MVTNRQGGFTLIEITIVLAITAGLATIVLYTQSGVRAPAEFRSTIEDLSSYLNQVKTTAQTSISSGSAGTTQSSVVFGELVTLTPGSSTITVTDMRGVNTSGSSIATGAPVNAITLGASVTHQITQQSVLRGVYHGTSGTEYTAANPYYIVFHRSLSGGQLLVYDVGSVTSSVLLNPKTYTNSPGAPVGVGMAAVETISLDIKSVNGNTGQVNIDGPTGGITTPVIQ